MPNPLAEDLYYVLAQTGDLWEELRGRRLFLTGGTGFFGCWLLESFLWANDKLGLGSSVTVLTRKPEAFRTKAPHLAEHAAVEMLAGDVRSFEFPAGEFSYVIHAATESSTKLNEMDPLLMLDAIIQGTRRTLDFAVHAGARKFLLTSSGAVYGEQPAEITHMPETYAGAPDTMDVGSAYAEGKRLAELLCAIYHRKHGIQTKIARCFAFVGPHLPLDAHFAIGNFIRDAIGGGPVLVKGDGTPHRSYLYAADLMIWLWTILMKGDPCRPYNVGSDEDFTIAQVAETVASAAGQAGRVQTASRPHPAGRRRYVPRTQRAKEDLGLGVTYGLRRAIERTCAWATGAAGKEGRAL